MKVFLILIGYFLTTVLAQIGNNISDLNNIVICATLNNVNRTFDNIWQVYNEFKTTGQVWTPVAIGTCSVNSIDCTMLNPVCAVSRNNFFKTFPNQCVLEAEQKATGTEWRTVFNGICSVNPGDGFATSTVAPSVTPAPQPWYAGFLGNTQQGQPAFSPAFAAVPVQNNQQNIAQTSTSYSPSAPVSPPVSYNPAPSPIPSSSYSTPLNTPAGVNPESIPFNTIPLSNPPAFAAVPVNNNQQQVYNSAQVSPPVSHYDPACDPVPSPVPTPSYSTSFTSANPESIPFNTIPLSNPQTSANPESIPFNSIPLTNPALLQLFSTLPNAANPASNTSPSYSVPPAAYTAPNPDCPPSPITPLPQPSPHYNPAPAPLPLSPYSPPSTSDYCNPEPSPIPDPYNPSPVPAPSSSYSTPTSLSSPAPESYNQSPTYGGSSINPSSYNPFETVPIAGTSSVPSPIPGLYGPPAVPSPSYSVPPVNPVISPIPGSYEPALIASSSPNYSIPSPAPGNYNPAPVPSPSYSIPSVNPELPPIAGPYDSAPVPAPSPSCSVPSYSPSSSDQGQLPSSSGDYSSVPAPQSSSSYSASSNYAASSPTSGNYAHQSVDNKPPGEAILSDPVPPQLVLAPGTHSNNLESIPFNTIPLTNPALTQIFSQSAAAPTSSLSPSYSAPSSNSPQSYAAADSSQSQRPSYGEPLLTPAPSVYPSTKYQTILTDPTPPQLSPDPAIAFNTVPLTNPALLQIFSPSTSTPAQASISASSPTYISNPSSQSQQPFNVLLSSLTSPAVGAPEISSTYSNPSYSPSATYPQQPEAGQVPCADSSPIPLILPAPLVPSVVPPSDYSSPAVSVPGSLSTYSNPSESNSASTYQQQSNAGQAPYGNADSSRSSLQSHQAFNVPLPSSTYTNPSEPYSPSKTYPQQPEAGQVPCDDSSPIPLILPAPLVPSDYSSPAVSVPGSSSIYPNPSESNSASTYQQQSDAGQAPYGNADSSLPSLPLPAPLVPSIGGVQLSTSDISSTYSSSSLSNYAQSEQKSYDNVEGEQSYQQSPKTYSASSSQSYGSNPADTSQSYQQALNTPSDVYSPSSPSAPAAQYNSEPSSAYSQPLEVPAAVNAPCSNAEIYTSPVLNYENVPSYTSTSNDIPASSDSYADKAKDSYNNLDTPNQSAYANSQDNSNSVDSYDKTKVYDVPAADNSNPNVNNEGQTIYNGVVYQGPYYYEPKYKHINFGNFNFLPSQSSAAAAPTPTPVSSAVPALAYPYSSVPGAQYPGYSTNPFEQLLKQLQYIATKNITNGY